MMYAYKYSFPPSFPQRIRDADGPRAGDPGSQASLPWLYHLTTPILFFFLL